MPSIASYARILTAKLRKQYGLPYVAKKWTRQPGKRGSNNRWVNEFGKEKYSKEDPNREEAGKDTEGTYGIAGEKKTEPKEERTASPDSEPEEKPVAQEDGAGQEKEQEQELGGKAAPKDGVDVAGDLKKIEGQVDWTESLDGGDDRDWMDDAVNGPVRAMRKRGNPHLFISGGPGSGKTTATHYIAEQRAKAGHDVVVFDMQDKEVDGKWPSAKDVIGNAGPSPKNVKNRKVVAEGIRKLDEELERRKMEGTKGGHKPMSIVMTDAVDMIAGADEPTKLSLLKIIDEGRKYGMAVVLDVQADNVGALNLPGAAAKLKSTNRIYLEAGDEKEGKEPTATVNGKKFRTPRLPTVDETADPERARGNRRVVVAKKTPDHLKHKERVEAEKNPDAFQVTEDEEGEFVPTDHKGKPLRDKDGNILVFDNENAANKALKKFKDKKVGEWKSQEFEKTRDHRKKAEEDASKPKPDAAESKPSGGDYNGASSWANKPKAERPLWGDSSKKLEGKETPKRKTQSGEETTLHKPNTNDVKTRIPEIQSSPAKPKPSGGMKKPKHVGADDLTKHAYRLLQNEGGSPRHMVVNGVRVSPRAGGGLSLSWTDNTGKRRTGYVSSPDKLVGTVRALHKNKYSLDGLKKRAKSLLPSDGGWYTRLVRSYVDKGIVGLMRAKEAREVGEPRYVTKSKANVAAKAVARKPRSKSWRPGDPRAANGQFGHGSDVVRTALHKHAADLFTGWLADTDVPADKARLYRATAMDVVGRMPTPCVERFLKKTSRVAFAKDMDALQEMYGEGLTDRVVGFYHAAFGAATGWVALDGHEGEPAALHGTYAHEFGHAIDGPSYEFSRTATWHEAWEEEIDQFDAPLSRYARTSASEGFAEFARLVFDGSDRAREMFPKCWAAWQGFGLIEGGPAKKAERPLGELMGMVGRRA